MGEQIFSVEEIAAMGLDDWRVVLPHLTARFATGRFDIGLTMVDRIGAIAEEMNHHPDLDLRYSYVDVRLVSHDVGALTQRDVDLARRTSEIAANLGVSATLPD